jgi:hypothetical protein
MSVRNRRGGIASGLQPRNFRVDEDGQAQIIRAFHPEDIPVAAGLVVDNSGSMRKKRSDVTAAAVVFARSSDHGHRMFIVNFNDNVTLGLPDTKLFSGSVTELESALLTPVPTGRTAQYDAIIYGLAHVQRSGHERKAQSHVSIHTIGLFDEEDPDITPHVLRRIAAASGGEAFLPGMAAGVVQICENIAKDIRTQYNSSYSPANQNFDGAYRTITVSVRADDGAKWQARTRAGYIAWPDGPAGRKRHR